VAWETLPVQVSPEGNPPLKEWDCNKDVLYLALYSLSIIIDLDWALNPELKFLLMLLSFCPLTSVLLPFFVSENKYI
jgi:hypothetical protein